MHSRFRIRWTTAIAAIALTAIAAACGDDTSSTSTASSAPPTTAAVGAPTTTLPATTTTAVPKLPATVTDGSKASVTITSADRIVTLLGSNTETVYALGLGSKIVGVDVTSQYPADVSTKTQLGNFSTITAEPVLSAKPTVVFAPAIPNVIAALATVKAAGVPVVFVPETVDFATGENRIRLIADALGMSSTGDKLIADLRAQVDRAKKAVPAEVSKLRVLYLTYRNNQLSVFGQNSAPYSIVAQLGAVNVVDEQSLKTGSITAEAIIAAKPDVILFPEDVSKTIGGPKAFAALPGVAQTPAATQGQIYAVDATKAQSLGPRAGEALADIVKAIATAKHIG